MNCFFYSSISSYLSFLRSKWYCAVISRTFLWPNPSSICFYLTTILYHYLLLLLFHFFHKLFCLFPQYLYSVFHRSLRNFISFFISLYSLNGLFTEINSSRLIYESIKDLEIINSIVFNLSFSNCAILLCFFFFSLYYNWLIFFYFAQWLSKVLFLLQNS